MVCDTSPCTLSMSISRLVGESILAVDIHLVNPPTALHGCKALQLGAPRIKLGHYAAGCNCLDKAPMSTCTGPAALAGGRRATISSTSLIEARGAAAPLDRSAGTPMQPSSALAASSWFPSSSSSTRSRFTSSRRRLPRRKPHDAASTSSGSCCTCTSDGEMAGPLSAEGRELSRLPTGPTSADSRDAQSSSEAEFDADKERATESTEAAVRLSRGAGEPPSCTACSTTRRTCTARLLAEASEPSTKKCPNCRMKEAGKPRAGKVRP